MRVTAALLFSTTSRNPGSWCVKPLWSWRQTVEVIRRFKDAIFCRHERWLQIICNHLSWRQKIASLNILITSIVWRQDHNGFTPQDPGFFDGVLNQSAARTYH